jgi:hypothetical protein
MVGETVQDIKETAMAPLLYNIPLMIVFFALWVGIPTWLVIRHPDTGPQAAQTAAVSYLPQQHGHDYQQAA